MKLSQINKLINRLNYANLLYADDDLLRTLQRKISEHYQWHRNVVRATEGQSIELTADEKAEARFGNKIKAMTAHNQRVGCSLNETVKAVNDYLKTV